MLRTSFAKLLKSNYWMRLIASIRISTAPVAFYVCICVCHSQNSVKTYFDFIQKLHFRVVAKFVLVVFCNRVVERIWDSTFLSCIAVCYVFHLYHIVCTATTFQIVLWNSKLPLLHMFVHHFLIHAWMAQFHFHFYFNVKRKITTTQQRTSLAKLMTVYIESR